MRGADPRSRSPSRCREGLGLIMSNVVLFPARRSVPASAISRHEFEKLADLALDIVERVISLLDEVEGEHSESYCFAWASA